jgi:hypothetical protein
MGSSAHRLRRKWQDYSGQNASAAEKDFFDSFNALFTDTEFRIRRHPKEFSNVYVNVKLSKQTLAEIYTPDEPITRHGVFPDYAIDNTETNKTIYIEVKRQDGWVEGKDRTAGRGNAHERSCKFFTPGLLKVLRKHSKLGNNILPFWTVFLGDITRDPCRVREITLWYDSYKNHYFFWRNPNNADPLIEHFITKIPPLLS